MNAKALPRNARKAATIIKNDGITAFSIKALNKMKQSGKTPKKTKIAMLVKSKDVLAADWTNQPYKKPKSIQKKSYSVDFIMSPPGPGSGGHQNLFRFIQYLEQAGHTANIYLYTDRDLRTLAEVQETTKSSSYENVAAKMQWLDKATPSGDALFATGWETAYPVFNVANNARKFYFVQDFEPYFYPVGSESILAENTYKFGFQGITAGGWLAKKLSDDYGMETTSFPFSSEPSLYGFDNNKKRKEIFFYARPVTPRRGFEMGVLALEIFHKKHPEYTINLAGWNTSGYDLPFPYNDLGSMPITELRKVYNRSAAALVMSLTNMSLLPLELLACGAIPVVNDGPNNRLVSDNPHIAYAENTPAALANALSTTVSMKDLPSYAKKGAQSALETSWDDSGKIFVKNFEEGMK